jgi:hypothetical protein
MLTGKYLQMLQWIALAPFSRSSSPRRIGLLDPKYGGSFKGLVIV